MRPYPLRIRGQGRFGKPSGPAFDGNFDSPIHPIPVAGERTMLVEEAVGGHRREQNRGESQQNRQKYEKPSSIAEPNLIDPVRTLSDT